MTHEHGRAHPGSPTGAACRRAPWFPFLLVGLLFGCASSGVRGPRKQVMAPPGATRLAAYSTAVRSGDLVFFSGVVGTRPGTRELVRGGVEAETRQALENLHTALRAAHLEPADVVKCTVMLADIRDYEAMNAVYARFFRTDPPARAAYGVSGLPLGARVEIDCLAAAPQEEQAP